MPPSPSQTQSERLQLHLSDPPSSAESRTVTFPAINSPQSQDRSLNGNKITQVDLEALGPRSPDRLKAALQAQESPGWSFVMKNEDFDFEYPKKMIRSEEPPIFKRSSEEEKPRRNLLSFGRKKSKATLSGSPGRGNSSNSSPRPMIPSPKPKRFPPLAFNPSLNQTLGNRADQNNTGPSSSNSRCDDDKYEDKGEIEGAGRRSFEPLNIQAKTKPPPTPPKQRAPHPSHIPLPPSPDRDSRRPDHPQFPHPARERNKNGDTEKDQPSPLDRYFQPSPARAIFDRNNSPSKRSFDHSHFGLSTSDSRNGSTSSFFNRESSSQGQGGLPSRQGLRDMLLASMDLLLEDHFVTLESNHQSQIRRISHLERSAQDSSMALVQAQKDYTALESTVLQDREKAEHLSKELDNERSLRKAQAEESTSLISQLEKQLHSQRKTTCSLESRVNTLSKQLKESQSEIDRLEGEMTKGYTEMNGRLSNIGRLEKEGDEWKRRAEEAEFTVKALREEGVRMSRELEKKGKIIEELEKGRKFVTRV